MRFDWPRLLVAGFTAQVIAAVTAGDAAVSRLLIAALAAPTVYIYLERFEK